MLKSAHARLTALQGAANPQPAVERLQQDPLIGREIGTGAVAGTFGAPDRTGDRCP